MLWSRRPRRRDLFPGYYHLKVHIVATKRPVFPDEVVDPREVPFAEIKCRGDLPHLFKDGCSYFVTFCLRDVAPGRAARRARLSSIGEASVLAEHSEPHPASGSCLLREPGLAAIVEEVLLKLQGEEYTLSAWCVMPNHAHAVVTPFSSIPLSTILQAWKSVSSHRINRAMDRKGPLWQRESFDHLVRTADAFGGFVEYTENNPVAAGLIDRAGDWPFSSARFREPEE